MRILAMDTSTDVCSVAVFDQNGIIAYKNSERDFSHAALLNGFIQDSLMEAGLTLKHLDAISIASGPGSYTGLRVAASTAKGLCFGLDIPLIAIDSITSLAYGFGKIESENAIILPMIDARRDEVYTASFDFNKNRLTEIQKIAIDQTFFESFDGKDIFLCGNGFDKFKDILDLNNCTFGQIDCGASTLWAPSIWAFSQQKFEKLDIFSPFYLSNPKITASKKNILL